MDIAVKAVVICDRMRGLKFWRESETMKIKFRHSSRFTGLI